MVLNRQVLHEMNKILSFCACSAFAISSDATSSLERLKSARSQRRKIGRILGNCGVNNDRAIHGYWRHAPAAWAWHGASLSTNNLQWCHSCPGGSETAWCLHICNLYTKLELGFKAFTSSKDICHSNSHFTANFENTQEAGTLSELSLQIFFSFSQCYTSELI